MFQCFLLFFCADLSLTLIVCVGFVLQANMMVYARALVATTKAAQADGNAAPLQAALDDALATDMEPQCAAAVKARKVLRSLQKKEAAAAAAAAEKKAEDDKAAAEAAAAAKQKANEEAAAAKVDKISSF